MIDNSKTFESKENVSKGSEVSEILQKKDFGASLRLAREKSALSLSDVAGKLLISVDIIKALENSQADALPALIFTQGYIRSYAKLLGVSAEEIIDDYVTMMPESEPELTPNSGLPAQKCSNDKLIKLISYGFVITAIIVFVFWFINADFTIKPNEKTSEKTGEKNIVAALNAQSQSVQQVELQRDELQQLQLTATADTIKLVDNDEKEITTKSEMVESETIGPDITTSKIIESKVKNQTPTAADKLSLSALGDSWCEIQDSTGKRLYYQLLNRGEEVELIGVAPFMVFLGNAPKIRVEINNKIVDFESLINKNSNIASLEISKDAAVISQTNQ